MEIVDRRKINQVVPEGEEHRPAVAVLEKPKAEEFIGKREWTDVAFMIAFLNINGNQTISGRAVGLRSDGRAFVADYLFSPVWERGFDWTAVSEERLNTFLDCGCKDGTACEMHEVTVKAWYEEGLRRIQAIGSQGVPPAVEAFMRAQQQKPNIVVPGR